MCGVWRMAMVAWLMAMTGPPPAGAAVAAEPGILPLLTIRTMSREELAANPTARVRGVVIRSTPDLMVIQDPTGGLYVSLSLARERGWLADLEPADLPAVGVEVEVEGLLDPGGFSPLLVPRSLTQLGPQPLPEPRRDPDSLLSGGDDSQLVEFSGIVREVVSRRGRWFMIVSCQRRRVIVGLAREAIPVEPAGLIDARVRFRGIAAATFTPRGEFRDPFVHIDEPGWVEVEELAPHPPFEGEKVPLRDICRFRTGGETEHLIRTEGTVVHAVPGEVIHLQDAAWGIVVNTRSTERFAVGDRVEASGFLEHTRPAAGLAHALVRHIGSGPPPEPFAIGPAEVLEINRRAAGSFQAADPGDYHGCLVRFPARLVELNSQGEQPVLVLDAAGSTVLASFGGEAPAALEALRPGSEIEITGIVQLEPRLSQRPAVIIAPAGLSLLARSAADVVVIRPPSPWTPGRLATLLAATLTALGLAVARGWWLRRQRERLEGMVADRTRDLAEARAHEKRLEERQRLTLEQKLKTSLTASAVAHEINQPLARLLLKCRLEADREPLRSEFIEAVVGDAERVVTTIEKMKVLLRNVETAHAPIDLAQVVTSGLHQVKRLLATHGVTVSRTGPTGGCIVEGDDVQLQFAISNLLRNAVEAIAGGDGGRREIEIAIHDAADQVEIVVGDSGPGWPGGDIDDQLLTSSKPAGTGVGLFVVRTAVENHGGSITVGRSPLGGAEFRIQLPRQGRRF